MKIATFGMGARKGCPCHISLLYKKWSNKQGEGWSEEDPFNHREKGETNDKRGRGGGEEGVLSSFLLEAVALLFVCQGIDERTSKRRKWETVRGTGGETEKGTGRKLAKKTENGAHDGVS